MKFDTLSEELFNRICLRHGYTVQKITVREDRKTADFYVDTPQGRIVAEVEELRPNDDDLRQIKEMKNFGTTGGGCTIGARARNSIRHAAKQLRDHAEEGLPMIAVLYDNVRTGDGRVAYPMFYVEPHQIDAAMYGDRQAHISLHTGKASCPDSSGGSRTMTMREKRYVSAVSVISDWDDETFLTFHNSFADSPLTPEIFYDSKCHHFRKGADPYAEPWKWHRVEDFPR